MLPWCATVKEARQRRRLPFLAAADVCERYIPCYAGDTIKVTGRGRCMTELGRSFRDWIAARKVAGCTTTVQDSDHILIKHEYLTAQVNFYTFDDMPEVVELAVAEDASGENRFFLHFELEDLERAKQLFGEMANLLEESSGYEGKRVLLCCTVGMTTTMFAAKLTEVASTLSLDYTFEARALEDAKRESGSYDAVMLAPQVGFRRREVAAAFPDALVFEIPARIFARYDGAGALRMLMGLLGDDSLAAPDPHDLRVLRSTYKDVPTKTVLVISVIHRPHGSTISWRLFDRYELVASEEIYKSTVELRDIEDVIATLHLKDIDVRDIDAVGVAVPGAVDYGTVTFSGFELTGANIEQALIEKFGLRTFVDNNANAGAVGCYVSQGEYDSVTLHTQQVGTMIGGQGTVCNGHLLRGRRGMAGELSGLNWQVFLNAEVFADVELDLSTHEELLSFYEEQASWSGEAMLPILATMLQANIAVAAPDAIYISYDLVDDMGALRAELAKSLPEEFIPDLIHITDYHEKIFLGELALVTQRLTTKVA